MNLFSRRNFMLASAGLAVAGNSFAQSANTKVQKAQSERNSEINDETLLNAGSSNLVHPVPYNPSAGLHKDRGLLICGSGDYMLAWTIGYFYALYKSGVDLSSAEIIVGTSAGAIAGSAIATGHLTHLIAELNFFTDMPLLLAELSANAK